MERLRAGVIGVGAIAQIMHLPYLRELDDRFQIAALCDVDPVVLAEVGRQYGVDRLFSLCRRAPGRTARRGLDPLQRRPRARDHRRAGARAARPRREAAGLHPARDRRRHRRGRARRQDADGRDDEAVRPRLSARGGAGAATARSSLRRGHDAGAGGHALPRPPPDRPQRRTAPVPGAAIRRGDVQRHPARASWPASRSTFCAKRLGATTPEC